MIACVDVGYQTKSALAACAVIADWPDCDPSPCIPWRSIRLKRMFPESFTSENCLASCKC